MSPPRVSIVVPARNAERTLAATLASVRAQTHEAWEVVVVDDGSTDRTADIVRDLAAIDPRFRLCPGPGVGVAAARNAGIAAASHPWLLFLDADDTILPDMLERIARTLEARPSLDLVEVGWVALLPSGAVVEQEVPGPGEPLFPRAAVSCPFTIHSVVVRKALVESLGGFDVRLHWGEDWDLWMRCGRAGARTAYLEGVGAVYAWLPHSGATRIENVLRDGLEVTRRAYAADPRVPNPLPEYAQGQPASERAVGEYSILSWTAGLAVARGQDPIPLVQAVDAPCPTLHPSDVAAPLFYAVLRARAVDATSWITAWPELRAPVVRFFEAVEAASGGPDLAARARRILGGLILESSPESDGAAFEGIGACDLELRSPERLAVPPGAERIHVHVKLDGHPVGRILVPVLEDADADALAREAACRLLAWPLVRALDGVAEGRSLEHAMGRVLPARVAAAIATRLRRLDVRGFEWIERSVSRRRLLRETLCDRRGRPPEPRNGSVDLDVAAGLPAGATAAGAAVALRFGAAPIACVTVRAGARAHRGALRRTIARELTDELAAAVAETRCSARGPDADAARPVPITVPLASDRRHARAAVRFVIQRTVPPVRRALGRHALAERLPVIAYHQIAEGGGGWAGRYRLGPDAFEAQLASLREHGFYSVTIEAWDEARRGRTSLTGKPLLITFDDGYADIAETAWPLLRRYGYSATVFIVTELVGKTSAWDHHLAIEAPLLTWDEIRALEREGLRFGSHTAGHAPLGALSAGEIRRELEASRRTLHERLAYPSETIAYPYGDTDEVVELLARRGGYRFGFTTEPRLVTRYDHHLHLPRIEVAGSDDPELLAPRLSAELAR